MIMTTILFICGLCNNTVSGQDYTASDGRVIKEWWVGKHVEGSSHGLF
jgi:hypothetical protein